MDTSAQRVCRRCLLRDMPEKENFQNMYAYINRIPKEDKVSEEVYGARLLICKQCTWLLSGMCRLCGCYVELRAAMNIRSCPDVPARWKNQNIKSEATAQDEIQPDCSFYS